MIYTLRIVTHEFTLKIATGLWGRLRGLIKDPLTSYDGILLAGTNQVHTFLMDYAIDCIFLDKQGNIVGREYNKKPNNISRLYRTGYYVIELPYKEEHKNVFDSLLHINVPNI